MATLFSLLGVLFALLLCSQHPYPNWSLVLFMISLVPMALLTVNDGYLKGMEKFGHSAVVEIVSGLAKFVVLWLALMIGKKFDLSVALMLFLPASLLAFMLSTFCVRKFAQVENVCSHFLYKWSLVKSLFGYSKWVCFSDLMNTGILLSGNIFLSYQNSKDLALFNVVIFIYSIFQIGFGAVTTVLIPQVSRQHANNKVFRLLGRRELCIVSLATIVLIICLLMLPYSQEILLLLFNKPEYVDAFNYIAILLVAFPFRLLTMTNKGIVQGMGQPRRVALAALGAFLTHALLLVPCYKLFGITGSMVAMVLAYFVEFYLTRQAAVKSLSVMNSSVIKNNTNSSI
jgi:O-antigen/teichoic acid export membrane protein